MRNVNDTKGFPANLAERMQKYGRKPSWKNWHDLETQALGDELPVHLVSAGVRSMSDREVRKFVRKHGPLNLKVYFNLDRILDRAVHPETRDYFGYCTEERRLAVNKVWRMAAYQMVGKAFDDAFETVERDQA